MFKNGKLQPIPTRARKNLNLNKPLKFNRLEDEFTYLDMLLLTSFQQGPRDLELSENSDKTLILQWCKWLLENGANPNRKVNKTSYILSEVCLSAFKNDVKAKLTVMELLCMHGANPTAKDIFGANVLEYARACEDRTKNKTVAFIQQKILNACRNQVIDKLIMKNHAALLNDIEC